MPATSPTSPYILIAGARILYAPLSSALPLDSVALGAAWPAAWKEFGFTNEPLKFNTGFEIYKVMVEQRQAFIAQKKTNSECGFESRGVDFSADAFKATLGGTKTTASATSSLPPVDIYTYTADDFVPASMWGIEGGYIFSPSAIYPVRIFGFIGYPGEGSDFDFAKAKEAGLKLNVDFASQGDGTVYQIRWVTGVPTA